MISPTKTKLLGVLAETCELYPAARLGQTIHWVGFSGDDSSSGALADIENDAFLELALRHRDLMAARLGGRNVQQAHTATPGESSSGGNAERAGWTDRTAAMSPETRQALDVIAQICDLAPDVRMGRLMCLIDVLGESFCNRGLADLEDDELLAVTRQNLETLRRGREAVAEVVRRRA